MTGAAGVARRTVTRPTMGTVASLTAEVAEPAWLAALLERVGKGWDAMEALVSGYRPDSEVSRINRGGLALAEASPTVRQQEALARRWKERTGGLFTPRAADGSLDLHGVAKAAALDEARVGLLAAGLERFCLSIGGDVVSAGGPWVAGIVDPADRGRLAADVVLDDAAGRGALATSGSAERGAHIRGARVGDLVQVSVLAADIVTADVLATAIVAGGADALTLAEDHGAAALAVTAEGRLLATARWPLHAAEPTS